MEVIQPGSRVSVGDAEGRFEAFVAAVQIGMNGSVNYRCSWWIGREFKDMWIDGPLVQDADDKPPLSIGFTRRQANGRDPEIERREILREITGGK